MRRWLRYFPVVLFIAMATLLYLGLGKDPQKLPSALVGKNLPDFELATLDSDLKTSLRRDELVGEPMLMNIWATWCATCLIEHPYLYQLSQRGVKIIGINYKDDAAAAKKWLKKYKNPYATTLVDTNGRFGFDLGVTGAPETFLVNAEGQITYRHVGIVDESVWLEHFSANFPAVGIPSE